MKKILAHVLKVGDSLLIDGQKVTVTLQAKSGQRAKLIVIADHNVDIQVNTDKSPKAELPHMR